MRESLHVARFFQKTVNRLWIERQFRFDHFDRDERTPGILSAGPDIRSCRFNIHGWAGFRVPREQHQSHSARANEPQHLVTVKITEKTGA